MQYKSFSGRLVPLYYLLLKAIILLLKGAFTRQTTTPNATIFYCTLFVSFYCLATTRKPATFVYTTIFVVYSLISQHNLTLIYLCNFQCDRPASSVVEHIGVGGFPGRVLRNGSTENFHFALRRSDWIEQFGEYTLRVIYCFILLLPLYPISSCTS